MNRLSLLSNRFHAVKKNRFITGQLNNNAVNVPTFVRVWEELHGEREESITHKGNNE